MPAERFEYRYLQLQPGGDLGKIDTAVDMMGSAGWRLQAFAERTDQAGKWTVSMVWERPVN